MVLQVHFDLSHPERKTEGAKTREDPPRRLRLESRQGARGRRVTLSSAKTLHCIF